LTKSVEWIFSATHRDWAAHREQALHARKETPKLLHSARWHYVFAAAALLCPLRGGAAAAGDGLRPQSERGASADLEEVFKQLVSAAIDTDWPRESVARQKLMALGAKALPVLLAGAEHHAAWRVRRSCYELLWQNFPTEPSAIAIFIDHGLADTEPAIPYICAFRLGEHKIACAKEPLRKVLTDEKRDNYIHLTAAKSLAELGESDGILRLYWGAGSDSYMERYLANIGLKALTGKNLDDFDYDYREGRYVIGGVEWVGPVRPIEDAELRSGRYRALASYCRWLKEERPQLYKELDPMTMLRRRRSAQAGK
jgi:hypothetical protein